MNPLEIERIIITSSLAYATYTAFTCPCGTTNGENFLVCHLNEFITAISVPLVIALYVNRDVIAMKFR